MDTSRRNNLLYFRDLTKGTLDIPDSHSDASTGLLNGDEVPLNRLFPDVNTAQAAAKLREIGRRALANLEEKGLQTLFLTLGMATWPSGDGGRPPESAVLLVPIAIKRRGREGRSIALQRTGEPQVNLTLLHALETEYGCTLDLEGLLAGIVNEEEAFNYEAVFQRLRQTARNIPGFEIRPRAVIGNFSFQKMAMVKDLRERAEEMVAHPLIAAISGDGPARETLRLLQNPQGEIDPREIDRIPPENEFLILDADSSQQRVIAAVLAGQDGVIQGPPGGGKSQTIANLIASLAAEGRRVLFVAEKRAALEVVLRRLEETGLGHLVLDLHGADISTRAVMKRIGEALSLIRETTPVTAESVHGPFSDRRKRLNEHVARMHTARPPSGLSVYELQGRLLRLPGEARASLRWRGASLDRLDASTANALCDLLREAGGFSSLFFRDDPAPWTGATLADGVAVQQAMDFSARIAYERWPALRDALNQIVAVTGLSAPTTLDEARNLLALLGKVTHTLTLYDAELFRQDLDVLAVDLAPAGRGVMALAWAWCTKSAFRKARQNIRAMRRSGLVSAAHLLAEVQAAADQRRRWRSLSTPTSVPIAAPELETARRRQDALDADLAAITAFIERQVGTITLDEFGNLFNALATDTVTPFRILRLTEIEREIKQRGAGALLNELRVSKINPVFWPDMFTYTWLASCLDNARLADPAIAGFNGNTHEGFVGEFRNLDRERLKLAAARVRRAHGERAIDAMNKYPEQEALVRREAEKQSRHLPLRKLLAQAPDVMTALFPCWMASPLSVSQLLDASRHYFDIVLFDEASQVLPEDAVPSLLRASRVVVAGDRHQLPPTTFFADGGADGDEDEDDVAPTEGFQSLLDLMSSFLQSWPLEWHYRSHDERLIAFSNRHIYGDRLITFPGIGGPPCITHILVPHVLNVDGQEESASAEVQRVVELILEHATNRPDETLGVIAMGIRHALRVEAALDDALDARPDLDDFFDPNRHERFFVKNLERVQGDERDAIILTVGYGKDRVGNLPYRFGPLLYEGGERRLNVAVTRARRRMTLVSSFSHQDMDPNRSRAKGVELLRLYLQYTASNGGNLEDSGHTGFPMNPFEADVHDTLASNGIPLLSQWGASRYRIDLVAKHPQKPGRFVLAIECDGASYHSAPTARDRDRLRQQQLEALGWRFHRIWSTDWFQRRDKEIERTVAAYQRAVEWSDQMDATDGQASRGTAVRSDNTTALPSVPIRRGPRPHIPQYDRIDQYQSAQLIAFIRWIKSDGLLRTDEEILSEMIQLLGFQRRGPRIVAAIQNAIERCS